MKNKIFEKMLADKEILQTMPKNNEKNIEKYKAKVNEMRLEYLKFSNEVYNEINKRFEEKTKFEEDKVIEKVRNEVYNYEEIIEILNDQKTSYQKTGLNKETYYLSKYYKDNLENVNNKILVCINIFRNLGINISEKDFKISEFTNEYMKLFFEEMKKVDVNSEIIKNKFEEIYWKCPDIITHIDINIKNIYMDNINKIDKFYEKRQNEILNKYKVNKKSIVEEYYITKKELERLELFNKENLISKFLTGELNVKDYTDEKVKSYYEVFINKGLLEEAKKNPEKMNEIDENMLKLMNNLYEYKKITEYKFIIDEILNIYKEKDKYKVLYKTDLKHIKSNQIKLRKLNKNNFLIKKENKNLEINSIINQLKEDYKMWNRDLLYSKIANKLSNSTSLYDVLNLASNFYEFLVDCIIKNDNEIEQMKIDEKIEDLQKFIKFSHMVITKNIYIEENKDIALIIKDRYKLLQFNIEREDLSEDNIDKLIDILEKIRINYAINKVGLNIKEISNICNFNKIIEEDKK